MRQFIPTEYKSGNMCLAGSNLTSSEIAVIIHQVMETDISSIEYAVSFLAQAQIVEVDEKIGYIVIEFHSEYYNQFVKLINEKMDYL